MTTTVATPAATFLTAEWRHLVMLNYEVSPDVLAPFVPRGTTLDTWRGRTYVSLVAFRFLHTRVRGVAIPFHRNFDEINLRFYVGREGEEGWRRGVVFIKEVVPRWAIAAIARWVYHENYVACPTRSNIVLPTATDPGTFAYRWKPRGLEPFRVEATVSGEPVTLTKGSEAEFITEHYWGYAAQRDGGTVEYRVEHPSWRIWPADSCSFTGPATAFYGEGFALQGEPTSAFVAAGSEVTVQGGASSDLRVWCRHLTGARPATLERDRPGQGVRASPLAPVAICPGSRLERGGNGRSRI